MQLEGVYHKLLSHCVRMYFLCSHLYSNLSELNNDIELMLSNSEEYFGRNHFRTKVVQQIHFHANIPYSDAVLYSKYLFNFFNIILGNSWGRN